MATYCQDCSLDLFGRDFGDFAGITTPDETRQGIYTGVICESCDSIEVDHTGRRILKAGDPPRPKPATPDTRALVFKQGGVSICWHCQLQLVRVRGGFTFAEVRDPIGNVHRLHQACVPHVVGEGYSEVQPEIASRGTAGVKKCA